MSVQPKRRTSSQKKRRASHFALSKVNLTECKDCGTKLLPHRICSKCGGYQKGKK